MLINELTIRALEPSLTSPPLLTSVAWGWYLCGGREGIRERAGNEGEGGGLLTVVSAVDSFHSHNLETSKLLH